MPMSASAVPSRMPLTGGTAPEQIKERGKVPDKQEVRGPSMPNAETRDVLEQAYRGEGLTQYASLDDLNDALFE